MCHLDFHMQWASIVNIYLWKELKNFWWIVSFFTSLFFCFFLLADVTNELLGRIAKLEEVVNDLASKSNNSSSNISHRNIRNNHNTHHHAHRHQSGGDIDDDSVHCVSYNIPSPHRSYNSSSSVSPPIRYTALNDIDNTINLDNYNPGNTTNNTNDDVQNEYSDSVESIESDDSPANLDDDHHNDGGYVGNNRRSPMRRRNESVTYDPPMSPVYGSSVVHTGPTRGRREAPARHNPGGRQEHRSRSPTSTGTRQTVNRRSTNATTTTTTLSSGRNNRRHHHQHSFDDDDYEGGRGEQPSAMVDDGLVLRIGVSRTVSDSSASASSTDSDTEWLLVSCLVDSGTTSLAGINSTFVLCTLLPFHVLFFCFRILQNV